VGTGHFSAARLPSQSTFAIGSYSGRWLVRISTGLAVAALCTSQQICSADLDRMIEPGIRWVDAVGRYGVTSASSDILPGVCWSLG
jgi:hypothetical protein